MTLRDSIFLELKKESGLTAFRLSEKLGVSVFDVENELSGISRWLTCDVAGRYSLRVVLDPIPKIIKMNYQFEELVPLMGKLIVPYMNPYLGYTAPHDQGGRGTCVGHAWSQWEDLNYVKLTGDYPTEEDRKRYKKNVSIEGTNAIVDVLYPQSFSAECAYDVGKRLNNCTWPSGSMIEYSLKALLEYGICREDVWRTSKTPYWVFTEPSEAAVDAAGHKIKGYASVSSWDAVRLAIQEKGAIVGAITVFENYLDITGTDGTFPEPRGSEAGGHALCFVGFDENYLYCLHSWGDVCGRVGRISKRYFERAWISGIVPLDDEETKILKDLYLVTTVKTNVFCEVMIDGKSIGKGQEFKVPLRVGQSYKIHAVSLINGSSLWETVTGGEKSVIEFTFPTPKPPTPSVDSKSLFKKIWEQIKKKLGIR